MDNWCHGDGSDLPMADAGKSAHIACIKSVRRSKMPRRKQVTRSGRKYGHIKLEEVNFPDGIDHKVITDFLDAQEGKATTGQDVHDWKEFYDSDPEDIQIECIFDEIGKAIPTTPSTILNTYDEHTVYIWLIDDTELNAFKRDLNKRLRQYSDVYGGKIFRKEIADAIERGFKRGGLERDDIIKIMDEMIAKEIMGS